MPEDYRNPPPRELDAEVAASNSLPPDEAGMAAADPSVGAPEGLSEGLPEEGEARPSRRNAWLAMGAVALALGLLWLVPGLGDDHAFESPYGDDFVGFGSDAGAVGQPAPLEFTLKDLNGVDVRLSSFSGKVILLNFWATWCAPCKAEIPDLVELQAEYGDDLVVLGLLVQDRFDDNVRSFAAQYKINYPVLDVTSREDVQDALGPMWALPATVIVGRDGTIVKKHTGMLSKEQFQRELESLL